MSGGEKKRKNTRSQGWEEAGSEFYQESYPGDAEIDALWKDPKRLATLLPSKQTRAIAATIRLRTYDTRTNPGTVRRYATTRSRRDSTVHRRASTLGGDVQVSMLPDLSEMKSNEETAWEKIMQIKGLPISMARKREEKAQIMNEDHLRLQGLEEFNWKRRKLWHQFKSRIAETYHKMELWKSDFKHIEGQFGTGVVAFFRFLKWLLFLNAFIFLLVLLLIVLPIFLLDDRDLSCAANSSTTCFSEYYCGLDNSNLALAIIQGTGQLEKTPFFYGYYPNQTFSYKINNTKMFYNIPLTYVLATVFYFLVSLTAIVRTGAKGFREQLLKGEGQFYQYSNLIFGGWDYCINNEKSAKMKHKAIFSEIKNLLETEKLKEEKQGRTKQERYKIFLFRFLVNTIVMALLTLCGGAIYFVFDFATKQLNNLPSREVKDTETKLQELLYEFMPSMCIVALNVLVPFLFQFLISYETYSPIMQLRMTLIRTVFLRLASLIMFYVSMYSKIRCNETLGPNLCTSQDCDRPRCWETFVGQQIYKLLLTDFAIQLGLTFIVNFLRGLLARHIDNRFVKLIGEQNFDLPKHVLDVVYTQTLCWVGIFFMPFISIMACFIFFVLFYVKKFACLINSKPGTTVYRASGSNSLFMVVTLVSYVVALVPIAFVVSELEPSTSCGPFRSLSSIWSLVVNTFLEAPLWIRSIATFLTTAGFAIPIFIILLLLLYYYTAVNSANRHMVTVLKNQLVLEGHDKKFLIDRLLMFIKQENEKKARFNSHMMDGDTITNASSIQS